MTPKSSRYRWFVVVIFFFFMLLHQTDKLMIGSLQVPISETFNINNQQWGLINSGALIVATILYPIWGYLYDRYARAKLLSLASFIWGATTWLNAIVRSFGGFLVTRASTGIDDSSYPGLYTLIADYFGPNLRGKIYGILQLAQPLGYLVGMILALIVAPMIGGWRSVFYITGSLGLVVAVLIYFGVKEMPRGKAEPEFEGMTEMATFHFSWKEAREIFKKRTMWFVFLQGFAGVFPWNVITYFFFAYLIKERGYDNNSVLFTMAPIILILAAGYFVGGALGRCLLQAHAQGPHPGLQRGCSARRALPRAGHPDAHRSPHPVLHLYVPDGDLHAALLGQRDRHGVRCDRARGALHRPGRRVFCGKCWRGLRPHHHRCDRRCAEPADRHPGDLLGGLGPVLRLLPGRPLHH